MPGKSSYALLLVLALALVMCGGTAHAGASQFHFRGGMLTGDYKGPQAGSFWVPTTADFEYEMFLANKRSVVFRTILAMELTSSRPYYTYAGSGMRHYFGSKGMLIDLEDEGVSFSALPKWRYYFGWDAGISQAIIMSLGKILQVVSTMTDVGANAGAIYQFDRRFGLEVHLGVTAGQGFSSVSVLGLSMRAFAGMTYHF